ncbi:hypothetical protein K0T92_15065 [Paenibacillus oenotherae]|uniref:Uncharacterized protein n=1 Tax=Paenibacillus oenotherae TaxID=1435645 RepID=A0ABS7D848_9BACL|nr:hypothetical protein [Paenibacillus oenotherae]MBW7476065.1 hypothetical protein [Paenibacillus oenotherae]
MLSFEEKLAIIDSYPELQRRDVSLRRVNYHYEESAHDKKIVVFHLHPNGNGYVYAGLLRNYEADDRGFVNIRDYSADELRTLLEASIHSLSMKVPEAPAKSRRKKTQDGEDSEWIGPNKETLSLKREEDMWYIYAGLNLDMVFETYDEAEQYLVEEGFSPKA